MFEFEDDPPQSKDSTDYTGLKILAILAPIFFVFAYFDKAEMGFTFILALGMILLAVKIHWRSRRHFWFWGTIGSVAILHVPLLFFVRWPVGNLPTIAYSLPLGIADFLVVLGALGLAERLFGKDSLSEDAEKE